MVRRGLGGEPCGDLGMKSGGGVEYLGKDGGVGRQEGKKIQRRCC